MAGLLGEAYAYTGYAIESEGDVGPAVRQRVYDHAIDSDRTLLDQHPSQLEIHEARMEELEASMAFVSATNDDA